MSDLTRKQQQVLDFIQKRQQVHGQTPTFQEIADQFGFQSLNSVTSHVRLLRQKGFLEAKAGKARALRVTSPLTKLRSRIVDIPLFGSIPAGVPQVREQDAEGCVSVDMESIGFKSTKLLRNAFALRVSGDSMIGKYICDGDIVVLEFGPEPRHGQIVAAYIDGASTLKTFLLKNGKPYLRAENPKYPDLIPAQELTIQGVFKALIRRAKD
jgi:repressor LexA